MKQPVKLWLFFSLFVFTNAVPVCEWTFDYTFESATSGCGNAQCKTRTTGDCYYILDNYLNDWATYFLGSYVQIPVNFPANGGGVLVNAYSLAMNIRPWLNEANPTTDFPLFNTNRTASDLPEIYMAANGSICCSAALSNPCSDTGHLIYGRWHRIGIIVNQTLVKAFFRGQNIATWNIPSVDGSLAITPAPGRFVLGGGTPIDRNFTIADVKFWGNTVLTDSDMLSETAIAVSNYYEWTFQNSLTTTSNMSGYIQYSRGSNVYNFQYDNDLNKTVLVSNSTVFQVYTNTAANGGGTAVNSFTVIMDVKIQNTSTGNIIPLFGGSPDGLALSIVGMYPTGYIGVPEDVRTDSTFPFNTWMQIALTADVSDYELRLFVNKVFVKRIACRGPNSNCAMNAGGFTFSLFGDSNSIASASISRLRFWNDILTDNELLQTWQPLQFTTEANPTTASSSSSSTSSTTSSSSSSSSIGTSSSSATSTSDSTSTSTIATTTTSTTATTSSSSSSSSLTTSDITSSTSSSTSMGSTSTTSSSSSSSSGDNSSTSTTTTASTISSSTTSNNSSANVLDDGLNKSVSTKGNNTSVIAGVTVAVILLVGLLAIGIFLFIRRRKNKNSLLNSSSNIDEEKDLALSAVSNIALLKNIIIGAKVGGGKFGEVYKGNWEGSEVALKKVSTDQAEEFKREANILCALQHPNVVRLFGLFIDTNGDHYMVMEYVSKGNLKALLERDRSIKLNDMFNMIISTCKGMVYLEGKGIIHRDLAARNILVSHINGKYSCSVADFGLSRETDEYKSGGSLIPIRWSAPEVLLHTTVTSKADVFSFAVVIHEILTYGSAPYDFLNSNREVMEYVCAGKRLPKISNCPDGLYNFMLRCWEQDPQERPSFKEALDILVELNPDEKKVSESLTSQGSEIYKLATSAEDYSLQPVDYAPNVEYQQQLASQNYNQSVVV